MGRKVGEEDVGEGVLSETNPCCGYGGMTVTDPILGPVLKRESAAKDIIGSIDKIGM